MTARIDPRDRMPLRDGDGPLALTREQAEAAVGGTCPNPGCGEAVGYAANESQDDEHWQDATCGRCGTVYREIRGPVEGVALVDESGNEGPVTLVGPAAELADLRAEVARLRAQTRPGEGAPMP